MYDDELVNWMRAKAICVSAGGNLVEVNTPRENEFLQSLQSIKGKSKLGSIASSDVALILFSHVRRSTFVSQSLTSLSPEFVFLLYMYFQIFPPTIGPAATTWPPGTVGFGRLEATGSTPMSTGRSSAPTGTSAARGREDALPWRQTTLSGWTRTANRIGDSSFANTVRHYQLGNLLHTHA